MRRFGCNIVTLDYRGYGFSDGKPSEAGIRTDVQTTMEFVYDHPVLKNTKLIMYGQSIGGAVTLDAAAAPENRDRLAGIIVENTFLSLVGFRIDELPRLELTSCLQQAKLVPEVMPIIRHLRLTWMVKDQWDSESAVARISPDVPMLFLSGAKDELIRPHNMHALYHAARARTEKVENTWWFSFPDGTHNDTVVMPGYMERIAEFWEAMISKLRPPPPRTIEDEPPVIEEVAEDKDEQDKKDE
jgi:fermentation-respiration switch protein FrsA (DUF1100 family)